MLVVASRSSIHPRSHSATLDRRSGDTFSPILNGGKVKPNEPIRLTATGIISILGGTGFVNFVMRDSSGNEVFRRNGIGGISGTSFIDTVSPMISGMYTFSADAQSFPFLSITHSAQVAFEVDPNAPDAPTEPPGFHWGDFSLGNLKPIIFIGLGVVGLVAVASAVSSLRK